MEIKRFKDVMLQYTTYLIRTAYYYVKDLQVAEDIVQEVFIKFYHNIDNYEERGEMKAYLTRMTINQSKDYLKSWSYRKIQIRNKIISQSIKKDINELIRKDEQLIIGEAILDLPLKYREVLIYYYFNDMSVLEISTLLAVSKSTINARLRQGREILKDKLSKIEWEVLLNE